MNRLAQATPKSSTTRALACICAAGIWWGLCGACNAQSAQTNLAPALQEIVKLSQAQMGDDAILAYIKNSGMTYNLSANDMLYLKSLGVSQTVITTMLQNKAITASNSVLTPVPSTPAPPPAQSVLMPSQPVTPPLLAGSAPVAAPEINFQYFHDQLSPYGAWVEVPGVGPCWKPAEPVVGLSPGWRPYYDNGQWVQTENGLFWQSDYTWGDIPFHYGRWARNPVYGWVWAPDYTWGPAWVFWRHAESDGAVGWAPLPVGSVFVDEAFLFHGARVGVEFDFGLDEDYFTFVEFGHFHERFLRLRGREYRFHVARERLHAFYGRSVVRNEFRKDEHGRFVNNGIGHDRMEHMTKVEHAKMEERHATGNRESNTPAKSGSTVASKVYRPPAPSEKSASSTASQSKTAAAQPKKK